MTRYAGTCSIVLVLCIAMCSVAEAAAARWKYPEDPDFCVVELRYVLPLIGDQDPTPLLRIYGDGRVRVHYPTYMKKAGDYELRLTSGEVKKILSTCAEKGVMTFDPHDIQRQMEEADARQRARRSAEGQPRMVSHRSEQELTRLEIHFQEVAPGGAGRSSQGQLHKTIACDALPSNARAYPSIAALGGLHEVVRSLRALCDRADLKRISHPGSPEEEGPRI